MSEAVTRYVWVDDPPLVFRGSLDTDFDPTAKTFTTLLSDGAIEGSAGEMTDGRTLELRSTGGDFYGSQRIRYSSGFQVYLGRSARGNRVGELNPIEADEMWVYDEYKLWSKIPHIEDDGTVLRDQTGYASSQDAQKPVANCGAFQFALGEGSDVTFTLQDTGSFATFEGASISSQSWDIADGTVVTGTTSDTSLTVSFPPGRRYVLYTVTDSNGIIHTAKQLIVNESTANLLATITDRITYGIDSLEASITVRTPDAPALRDGTAAAVIDVHADGTQRIAAFGWLAGSRTRQVDGQHGAYETTLTIEGAGERLSRLGAFPQTISRATDVAGTWLSVTDANIDRMITFVLFWHSTVFDVLDYTQSGLGDDYPLPEISTDGENLLRQFDRLFRAIVHRMTISASGVMTARLDKRLAPSDDQRKSQASDGSFIGTIAIPAVKDLTPLATFTRDDYTEAEINSDDTPNTKWVKSEALIAGTDPDNVGALFARAPSATPAQGAADVRLESQVVNAITGEFELLFRTANAYEMENNNPVQPVTLRNVSDIYELDPSAMQVFKAEFDPDAESEHGLDRTNDRWLLLQKTERYNAQHGYIERDAAIERIIVGESAQLIDNPDEPQGVTDVDPTTDSGLTQVGKQIETPTELPFNSFNLSGLPSNLAAILSDGSIAITSNADDAGGAVNWTVYDHSATLGTDVRGWCLRAGQANTGGWVTCGNGVFLIDDITQASPTITDQTPTVDPDEVGYWGIDADYVFAPGEIVIVGGLGSWNNTAIRALYVNTNGGSGAWTQFSIEPYISGNRDRAPRTIVISPGEYGRAAFVHRSDPNQGGVYFSMDYFTSDITQVVRDYQTGSNTEGGLICLGGIDRPEILFYGAGTSLRRYNMTTDTTTDLTLPAQMNDADDSRFMLVSDPNNTNNLAYPAQSSGCPIYVSHSALSSAPTWIKITTPFAVERCALVGSNGSGVFGFGGNEEGLCYSGETFAASTATDITGDLSMTGRSIIGIAGY